MSSNAWNTVSDVANVSGIAQSAVSSALLFAAGYTVARSPQPTALQDSWARLRQIKETLDSVPGERRHRIEAAAARGDCRSFATLEAQYQYLLDEHASLSREYANASIITRSNPWTKLRKDISTLQIEIAQLLNDTWTTTQAHGGSRRSEPHPRNRTISIPMDTLPADSGTTTQAHVGGNTFAPPSPLEEDVASISTIISLYSGSGTGSSMV
ncbi:hypothetical protein BGW80DRAFT_1306685 [Lactifluus volemus]|nr:hypothetical protein BGW80DRAFT_1306685 [Lactifluus volemus]